MTGYLDRMRKYFAVSPEKTIPAMLDKHTGILIVREVVEGNTTTVKSHHPDGKIWVAVEDRLTAIYHTHNPTYCVGSRYVTKHETTYQIDDKLFQTEADAVESCMNKGFTLAEAAEYIASLDYLNTKR